jgi:hypothetical protein
VAGWTGRDIRRLDPLIGQSLDGRLRYRADPNRFQLREFFLTHSWKGIVVTGTMRIPRNRGAISGMLLVLLGVWGAVIPFVGPYFDYAYTPDKPWDYTTGRLVLQVLPGLAAVLGGLLVLGSANRAAASLGVGWPR